MAGLTAAVSCRLLEVDFAAIEAKLTGWFARDPETIRLAGLGIHAALASHIIGRPYDPAAPDADLKALFKEIKAAHFPIYDRAKRAVYGDFYGQTAFGMMKSFPKDFPTLALANQYKRLLHQMAPLVPRWQTEVRERASKQNYLGGSGDHPYAYKHWFWDVITYRGITESAYVKRSKLREPVVRIQGRPYAIVLGADAKRVVAYYPQSTAAGVLKEALLRLFDPEGPSYIGDAYYGRTPLRAPIHDSGLFEIPNRIFDRVLERIVREMTRPIQELPLGWMRPQDRARLGAGDMQIGVAAKAGRDWGGVEDLDLSGLGSPAVDPELVGELVGVKFPEDDTAEGEESWASLKTVWQAQAEIA